MLLGISVVLLAGFAAGKLAGKCRIPPILGMMAAGIIIGPYCLDLIDGTTLSISADIRKCCPTRKPQKNDTQTAKNQPFFAFCVSKSLSFKKKIGMLDRFFNIPISF